MANPFVTKEVNKILNDIKIPSPLKEAYACAWILINYKGVNIKMFDHHKTSSLCDFDIIVTAQNIPQARVMVDEISYNLKQHGNKVISLEGLNEGEWILLDLGDVIIHIFQEYARDIYDLDSLWRGDSQVKIPEEYYFSKAELEKSLSNANSEENYF